MRRPFALRLVAGIVLSAAILGAACDENGLPPRNEPPGTPPEDSLNVYVVVGADEVILNGRLFGAENGPLVILTHMRPNDQSAWFPFARELAEQGFAALTFNFRGYGESTGEQDFAKLDDDLIAVIQYLRDQGRQQIFLVGASMGATASLVVAADLDVEGVVALSPPAEFDEQDALEAVGRLATPSLLVATDEDAPALKFDELIEAASPSVEEARYPGQAHGTDMLLPELNEQATALRERIVGFLQEHRG